MLYIFDQNGTLVRPRRRWWGFHAAIRTPADQEVCPGVLPRLAELRAKGDLIAIASNQEDVARGRITLEGAKALVEDCARRIGGVAAYRLCPFSPDAPAMLHGRPNPYAREDICRKPNPGMLRAIMHELRADAQGTVMVGNSEADRRAAEGAGVRFVFSAAFFGECA